MAHAIRTDCEGFHRRDFLKIGAGRPVRPDAAAAAATGSPGAPGRPTARPARPTPSSCSGSAAAPPPSTCGTSSPNAPEGIRGEFKPIDTSANGVQISEHLPKMAKVVDKADHRPLAEPHHPGARPGHGLHDDRQQADAGRAVSGAGLAGDAAAAGRGGRAAVRRLQRDPRRLGRHAATSAPPTTRSSSKASAARAARAAAAGTLRVRGIQLPTGFTLDELENRDKLLKGFDETFRAADKAADLVDGLDAFHKKALEILRSDKTKKAFDLAQEKQETARALRHRRRSARARWRPGGWSRRACAS